MARTATLIIDDKKYEFPLIVGSEGESESISPTSAPRPRAITLDPGFGNTGACTSAITFIDGEKGILRYRGIPSSNWRKLHLH